MPNRPPLITTLETAAILGIERSTISRWVERGFLTPVYQHPGIRGPMLFDRADVNALKERIAREGVPKRIRAAS